MSARAIRQEYEYAGLGNPLPLFPPILPESFITDEPCWLFAMDLAIRVGKLIGEPCGAGLAGIGEGTLTVEGAVDTTGLWSKDDQPLLRLLAELLTGKTDKGLTTTSVESESMAAVTLHP